MGSNFRHCLRVLPLKHSSPLAVANRATFSTTSLNSSNAQQGFEGLQAGFLWDHKHGFGYTKDGKVVIVKPQEDTSVAAPSGVEDEETESLLRMAQKTYEQSSSSRQDTEHDGSQSK